MLTREFQSMKGNFKVHEFETLLHNACFSGNDCARKKRFITKKMLLCIMTTHD